MPAHSHLICPGPRRLRLGPRRLSPALFVPLIVWPATWLLLCSTSLLNVYSYAWAQWMSFFRPAVIELQIDDANRPEAEVLAAQVRLGGRVISQTELAVSSTSSKVSRQIRLPLRAFGPLEVRLASVDARGCTVATGIGQLQAAGEVNLTVPIQLLSLSSTHCPSDVRAHSTGRALDAVVCTGEQG